MIPLLVYAPVEFGAEGFMGCGSRCDHLVESCANAAAKSYWNRELPSVFLFDGSMGKGSPETI